MAGVKVFRNEVRQEYHICVQHAALGAVVMSLVGVDNKKVALCQLIRGAVNIMRGVSADDIAKLKKIVLVHQALAEGAFAVGGEFHPFLKIILVFIGIFAFQAGFPPLIYP